MPLIDWRDEFSVGVPDVDHEHRQLIALINQLYADMSRQTPRHGVEDFLGDIYSRISAHFALEEKIMRQHRYDQYDDHKQDHERLLDELRDMMDDYEQNAHFDDAALAEALRSWFTEHFRTRDARLHSRLGQ